MSLSSNPIGKGPIGSSAIGGVILSSSSSSNGTLSATLGSLSISAYGFIHYVNYGALSETLGSVTLSGSGDVTFTFSASVAETVASASTASGTVKFFQTTLESIAQSGQLSVGFGLTKSESMNLTSSGSYVWRAGALVQEAVGVGGSLGANQVLVQVLAQSFGLSTFLASSKPVTVAEGLNLSGSLTGFLGALLADRLRIVETNAPALTYKQTLLEFVRLNDAAARFLSGAILEALGIAPSFTAVGQKRPAVAETVNLTSTISTKLIAIVVAPEKFTALDANALKAIFRPTVSETFSFDIGIVEPNGGFTTWAVNTRTGATTEYQNYAFNSFAQSGHHYLGASSTGLYVLDGADDDGTPTVATLRSGYAQFGGSRYSSFKAAYLGMRGDGDIFLKLEAGTGDTYTYQVKLQNQETTKVRIGKGLRARYFAWEMVTTGQDFDLDAIEFVPLVAQRRV